VLLWLFMAVMFAALELLRRDWTIAVLAAAALVAALTALIVATPGTYSSRLRDRHGHRRGVSPQPSAHPRNNGDTPTDNV